MDQAMNSTALKCHALVLKVASRCNLNCTYCYMYNLGDTTYKNQPRVMSGDVVHALISHVRAKSLRDGVRQFLFIFHGGEPLLAGEKFYIDFVREARRQLLPEIKPWFALQTNGTLLTERWCELFNELSIRIGVSLDGPPAVNDRSRVDHRGRGSYDRVRKGLETAMRCAMDPGLLTVIDVKSDPIEVYRHFKELGVSAVDFLLPEATYEKPPPGCQAGDDGTPYADWLIPIFDAWFQASPPPFSIRLFEIVLTLILGGASSLDSIGVNRNEVLVIETDGGIEPVGSLKICGNGFTKIGANVLAGDLDDAMRTDLGMLYHLSGERLCKTCARCPILRVCGGGYLPHRFSAHNGFDNPSVYCRDLMKLITHIQNTLLDELSGEERPSLGLTRLTYDDARAILDVWQPADEDRAADAGLRYGATTSA